MLLLVGAFYQNERDCYSGKFFSSKNRMYSGHFLQKLLNYWTGQVSEKRLPFHFFPFFNVTYKAERDERAVRTPLNFIRH